MYAWAPTLQPAHPLTLRLPDRVHSASPNATPPMWALQAQSKQAAQLASLDGKVKSLSEGLQAEVRQEANNFCPTPLCLCLSFCLCQQPGCEAGQVLAKLSGSPSVSVVGLPPRSPELA